MPTNEERRETAKRKLERQLESRAQQAKRRRILTVVGATGRDRRGRRRRSSRSSWTRTRTRPTPPPRRPPAPRPAASDEPTAAAAAATGSCRPSRPPADLGANCQYPAARSRPEAGRSAEDRQGAHRPGDDQRQHVHRSGQHRSDPEQRRGAVHGQQLRQPGPEGLLRRHRLPPADHRTESLGVLQCGDPTGTRFRRAGLPVRQRVPHQPVRQGRPGAADSRCSIRAARWRWPTPARTPTAASSSWSTRIRSCRRTTPCSAPSTPPAWPRWTRSPQAGVAGGGEDGKPATEVQGQVGPAGLNRRMTRMPRRTDPPPEATALSGYPVSQPYPGYPRYPVSAVPYPLPPPRGPTAWPSRRWSVRSCSRRWASCSATSRCRRSNAPARKAVAWRWPGW